MRVLTLVLLLSATQLMSQTLVRLWDTEITAEEVRGDSERDTLDRLSRKVKELFEQQYLLRNGLEPPPEAFEAARKFIQNATAKRPKVRTHLDDQTAAQLRSEAQEKLFVQPVVRSFYLSRALWKKHGGRLVLSAFGNYLAKDGMVQELRALEKAGQLTFPHGTGVRDKLYQYILDGTGDGVVSGESAREILAKSPWEVSRAPTYK